LDGDGDGYAVVAHFLDYFDVENKVDRENKD